MRKFLWTATFAVSVFGILWGDVRFVFAVATSTSFRLEDESINLGGGRTTSTTFDAFIDVGEDLIGKNTAVPPPPPPPPSGSPAPAPPAPPPPPPPPADVTAPVISGVTVVDLLSTSARITWTTDEDATSFVDYGLTGAYGSSASGTPYVTSHSVTLTGLTPRTTYHFRVRSADASGNEAASGDFSFTTRLTDDLTPPVISDIRAVDITETRAAIVWFTDESADSAVNYGLSDAYGLTARDGTFVLSHRVGLAGLTPGTTYHFRVRSSDENGNEAISGDTIFTTTSDTTPPVITDITVEVTESTAAVRWKTDEAADTGIEWGLTPAFELGDQVRAESVTEHAVFFSRLLGNTVYYFRVNSADAAGNRAFSSTRTFRTLPDLRPPSNVSDLVAAPSETSITLTWRNPPDADFAGVVIQRGTDGFPASPSDGARIYEGSGESAVDSGLRSSTTHYYSVFAYDRSGNFSSGALASAATLAPAAPPPPPPPGVPVVPPPAPALPPVSVPPITVPPESRLTIDDLQFWLAGRTLLIIPEAMRFHTLVDSRVGITLRPERLPRAAERVALNLGPSSYLFRFDSSTRTWSTDVIAPGSPGTYAGAVIVTYPEGLTDVIDFELLVDPYGYVYEISEGVETRVPQATVTLFVLEGGSWRVWDAERYLQRNPQVVPDDGTFGFMVPAGTYYLRAEKDGYRAKETIRFDVRDVVVNRNLELLRLPPSILEVIRPGASVAENAARVAKVVGEQAVFAAKVAAEEFTKVVDNPVVEEAAETVVAPATVTVAVANAAAAVPAVSLWSYLQYLVTQPFLLLQRRRRREWGVAYNALTRLPVDLAIIRLLDAATGRVLQSRVTDKEGRYAFAVSEGNYRIEATRAGFIFPTAYLKDKKEDFDFLDLYHGEPISVTARGVTVTPNIPLDPVEKVETPRAVIRRHLLRVGQHVVASLGIAVALAVVIISPTAINIAFLGLQIALYLLFRRLSYARRPKGWGIVYDEKTKKPLRFAVTRIFETQYNKLLEMQVTDGAGRYVFLVGRNKYRLTFERNGYQKKEIPEVDATREKKQAIGVKIGLEPVAVPAEATPPTRQ